MRIVGVALGLLIAAGPAFAADATRTARGAFGSGFYAGVGAGMRGAAIDVDVSSSSLSCSTTVINGSTLCTLYQPANRVPDSLAGYLLAGYARQYGQLVFAAEGDLAIGKLIHTTPNFPFSCNDYDVCATAGTEASINPFGHLRGILGLPLDPRITGFVAVGAAFAHAAGEAVATTKAFGPISENRDGTKALLVGLSLGGGVDFRVGNNARLRLESLYDQFGSLRFSGTASSASVSGGGSGSAAASTAGTARFSTTTSRVALIWDLP